MAERTKMNTEYSVEEHKQERGEEGGREAGRKGERGKGGRIIEVGLGYIKVKYKLCRKQC